MANLVPNDPLVCEVGQLSVVTLYTELSSSISDHGYKTDYIEYHNVELTGFHGALA
jgi:hypothetical protein